MEAGTVSSTQVTSSESCPNGVGHFTSPYCAATDSNVSTQRATRDDSLPVLSLTAQPQPLPFRTDHARVNRSSCYRCKCKLPAGQLWLARTVRNPFKSGENMSRFFHPSCLFESFKHTRSFTQVINTTDVIEV